MLQSNVIEVGGTFVGAAITTNTGFRFRAVHVKVKELDASTWRSLDELNKAARHLFTTGQLSAILASAANDRRIAKRSSPLAPVTGATPWMA